MEVGSYWKGWRIDKLLGEGAFGKVYKISRREMDFEYSSALKVINIPASSAEYRELKNQGMDDQSISAYFTSVAEDLMIELKIMSRLKGNTNIVSYEDHVIEKNPDTMGLRIYIRMELLTPLYDYIPKHPLTEQDIVRLGVDMCKAIEVCRKYDIIHRDIKPQNIFVSDLGDFKLGDFGIARRLEKTESGLSKKGTYSYMAPEVYKAEPYNHTVDIYSLGLVLYNFLNNNRTPFLPPSNQPLKYTDRENANIRRMRGEPVLPPCNASPGVAQAVLKACAYKPADRYRSATEFRQVLQSLLNSNQVNPGVVYDGKTPIVLNSTSSTGAGNRLGSNGNGSKATSGSTVTLGVTETYNPNNTSSGGKQVQVQPEDAKKKNKKLIPIIAASAAVVLIAVAVLIFIPKGGNNISTGNSSSTETMSDESTGGESSQSSQQSSESGSEGINSYTVDKSRFNGEDNINLTIAAPGQAISLMKTQVNNFIEEYPDINFGTIKYTELSEGDASAYVINDLASAPDLFCFPSDQLEKLVSADCVAAVPEDIAKYLEKTNVSATVNAATFEGSMYAYPETADNGYCLVYDKSVVSDSSAATLEGVLAACRKSGKKFVMDCGDGFYACTFAFTAGIKTDGYESDGSTQRFEAYDEDDAAEVLMAFSKLMQEYKDTFSSQSAATIASGFKSGTVGAGVDGTWNFSADTGSLGKNFGAAKLPSLDVNGNKKQLVSMMGYKYIGVKKDCAYPNAAQILALYLAGEKCQKERVEKLGWGPSNYEAQNNSSVLNSVGLNAIISQSKNSVAQVNIAPTFWTPMGTLGTSLLNKADSFANATETKKMIQKTVAAIRDE